MMSCIRILFIALILSVGTAVHADSDQRKDLSILEHPLLIGEWYYIADARAEENEPSAMRILLKSDNRFGLQILYSDDSSRSWLGHYSVSEQQLVLYVNGQEPQIYDYMNNHYRLVLNGVTFYKLAPPSLPGVWHSEKLSGSDIQGRAPSQLTLVLQPDFVFFIHSADDAGHEVVHSGVYYTENDHLVLYYQEGGVDTKYTLNKDTLTWNIDDGAVKAVMTRLRQ